MNTDIKEIDSIIFGIFSPKELMDMSVCKVEVTKLTGHGSVYDERMGPTTETNTSCVTCGKNSKDCPGHFGHIEFNEYIIHPLYYKSVVSFLRCFCIQCNRLLITADQVELCGLSVYKSERRFEKIIDKLEKIDICCHCDHPQPRITYSQSDNTITMVYKENVNITQNEGDDKSKKLKKNESKISIALTVDEINKLFDAISDDDVILCGFDPTRIHPRNLILSVFPVIPPCARPFVLADGNICDDDLTNQLLEIIKSNNILAPDDKDVVDEKRDVKKQKAIQSLKFRVLTYYNNSAGKAKHPTNGRPIKGIKERITGKEGQIRNNLMGKRVEFSGRTVIGPDPTLKFGWMGIPEEIAKELTIPERVTSFNKDYLSDIVNNSKANFIIKNDTRINLKYAMFRRGTELLYGDVVIRGENEFNVTNGNITLMEGDQVRRDGIIIPKIVYPKKKIIDLSNGDVVHRHLRHGDTILLNRQPTLHKGSMIAMKINVLKGKTFRMNLATTKSFNADFDGDEMNIHVPQSLESRAELENLSSAKHNIISAQASKPNIVIVQDSLLASYLMTKNSSPLTKSQFFDISMHVEKDGKSSWSPERVKTIQNVLKMKGKSQIVYNGRGLISLILPEDFIYEKKNGANPDEPVVRIYRGVLYEGAFDKSILGASHNSIIQVIHKEYGIDVASEFITNIQFITNNWLLVNGFSIGLEDCLITSPICVQRIQDNISKCYIEADGIGETTHNPGIREVRITAALSKAKDVGMKISKDSMTPTNNLLSTVYAGSKGDFFNIAQLTGLLGQQNLLGQRVIPTLNHGTRTLPHYPFGKLSKEVEYESRGFVGHSLIEGLNPQEFFFHAMSGREGICDTAMGTAKSGYIQRRIIKVCEDIQVKYDGSVRDTTGKVYQMAYGDNGMDTCKTVKVDDIQQACDISRIIDRLNLQYEIKCETQLVSKEKVIDKVDKNDKVIDKVSKEKVIDKVSKEKVIDKVDKNDKVIDKVSKEKNDKPVTRMSLLKSIAAKTGEKNMYKGVSIEDLIQKLSDLQ
jgi:DNA-directed RNA polymerase beta' subunit